MRHSLWLGVQRTWQQNPLPPILAALCFIAAILCVLLSTLFGVSPFSDWLLYVAEALLIVTVLVFTFYIFFGVVQDARDA